MKVLQRRLCDLSFKREFDLCLCLDVLHRVPLPSVAVHKLVEAVKPGHTTGHIGAAIQKYAEGQRCYIESFSAYTRQFLERIDKPDCDSIDGIPPAIVWVVVVISILPWTVRVSFSFRSGERV